MKIWCIGFVGHIPMWAWEHWHCEIVWSLLWSCMPTPGTRPVHKHCKNHGFEILTGFNLPAPIHDSCVVQVCLERFLDAFLVRKTLERMAWLVYILVENNRNLIVPWHGHEAQRGQDQVEGAGGCVGVWGPGRVEVARCQGPGSESRSAASAPSCRIGVAGCARNALLCASVLQSSSSLFKNFIEKVFVPYLPR